MVCCLVEGNREPPVRRTTLGFSPAVALNLQNWSASRESNSVSRLGRPSSYHSETHKLAEIEGIEPSRRFLTGYGLASRLITTLTNLLNVTGAACGN